jgi:predicted Zn-dependent peptidase
LLEAVSAILDQLETLKDGIPEAEIKKAQEISKGRLLLRMEDSRNVAGWLGGQEMLLKRILSLDEIISIIDSISANQVQSVARQLINLDKTRLAVVGPVSETAPLKKLLKIS